jgi:uncharacterized membrane protein YtjA (UPF0391 family)
LFDFARLAEKSRSRFFRIALRPGEKTMLGWALTFLILALIAGYMGFFGLAGLAATIAKLLLIVFVVLLIVSAFSGALRGKNII